MLDISFMAILSSRLYDCLPVSFRRTLPDPWRIRVVGNPAKIFWLGPASADDQPNT
jgi:hypothetical protein